MHKHTALVNENKLYSVIGKFFTDGYNMLLELIQNAQRANAKNVEITIPYEGTHPFGSEAKSANLLSISDDGRGIRDIVALLGIARSDWDPSIQSQDPAGMGFMQLLALSLRVYVKSSFGSLIIDSQKFLHDDVYRYQVLETTALEDRIERGTVIIAEMQNPWSSYLRSDRNWYRGYHGMNLVINGIPVVPITIKSLVEEAERRNNICNVLSYQQNSLFIEIGHVDQIVTMNSSAVNWYGQLIPVYPSSGLLSNFYIRFYYEVNKGTPLTPRFPDRTNLTCDDRYYAFREFLDHAVLSLLRQYFDSLPDGSRFSNNINVSLLTGYYDYAPESELASLDLVPVSQDAFAGSDYDTKTICSKASIRAESGLFHMGPLQLDMEYSFASESPYSRCYNVTERVAEQMRLFGINELLEVNVLNLTQNMINIEQLMLEYRLGDGSISVVPVSNALLLDCYDDPIIYADSVNQVWSIVDTLLEKVHNENCERSFDELKDEIENRITESLVTEYGIIDRQRFDFLPKCFDITQICFEFGNLAVSYRDGSKKEYALRM